MKKLGLVLLSLLLCACNLLQSGPEKTIRQFYENVEQGQLDAALDLVSSSVTKSLPKEKLKAGLAEATREYKSHGGVKTLEIKKLDVTGEMADVQVKLNFGDGTSKDDNEKLIKEKGDWKIAIE